MVMPLEPDDFPAFFREVHGHDPFPWQRALASRVTREGLWPDLLDLPTGFGKTAVLDIAVFHLALEAEHGSERRAAARIVLAVDRRLVVDDAFGRAERIAAALARAGADAPDGAVQRVAARLQVLAGSGPPLLARRLRGGVPLEDDWARTPSQPTILCSTVDQVGSRLLFRGYGISDSAKPMQAGLLGSDCRIFLDEAHLAAPFRETLAWVGRYQGEGWRESPPTAPWGVSLMTATPGSAAGDALRPTDEDFAHPVLGRRWRAAKPARLVLVGGSRSAADSKEAAEAADAERVSQMVAEVRNAIAALQGQGVAHPAIGAVVNRVQRARLLHRALRAALDPDAAGVQLMIGPARAVERDERAAALAPIRTGAARDLTRPLVLVATQCIEAGVDIDLDALVTDLASLDALRQRFGRLNRAGRDVAAYAAVVAAKGDVAARAPDPIYGTALQATWEYLTQAAEASARGEPPVVDFGIAAFDRLTRDAAIPEGTLAPGAAAPVLMPAHLDLLSQTSPIPSADPEVSLFLHGPDRQSASITALWRADVGEDDQEQRLRRLLLLVPPRAAEAIELPLWTVRRWLQGGAMPDLLGDVAGIAPAGDGERRGKPLRAFRWAGDNDASRWLNAEDLRPGDTLVLPSASGGVDAFGWNPASREPVTDVAARAAEPYRARRFVVRVALGLAPAGEDGSAFRAQLPATLAEHGTGDWRGLRDALLDLPLPPEIRQDLRNLDLATVVGRHRRVTTHLDVYPTDAAGRPLGVVFVAPLGLEQASGAEAGLPGSTEDDAIGSLSGVEIPLARHAQDVAQQAEVFAAQAGLPAARIRDVRLAGLLHDAGKADRRFQSVMAYGDPLGPDPDRTLAKSSCPVPRQAWQRAGLPPHWRHEALSVRLAARDARVSEADDPELVLWLIGTHHGRGRPFFPHLDPLDSEERRDLPPVLGLTADVLPAGPGPQSLAFLYRGHSWTEIFERLKARYGTWGLARMEAILRLADHRVSERERVVEPEREVVT